MKSDELTTRPARRRQRVVLIAALVFMAALTLLAAFRKDVIYLLLTSESGAARERVTQFVGHVLDQSLEVRVEGAKMPSRLVDVLPPNSIVMKYSTNCSACRNAVDQYLARSLDPALSELPALFLLSFKDDDRFPTGIASNRRLRAIFSRDESWFSGGLYPSIWWFGENSQLVDVMVGLNSLQFDQWMDANGPVTPAANGERAGQ